MNLEQEINLELNQVQTSKLALFPGQFDPFNEAHQEIISQASSIFEEILILVCDPNEENAKERGMWIAGLYADYSNIGVGYWSDLLVNFLQNTRVCANIRPLKNNTDLNRERTLYYSHQDLGIQIPFIYFMNSRQTSHVSSNVYKEGLKYLQ
jgi:pantetheine-phosphate adenylyltransferase